MPNMNNARPHSAETNDEEALTTRIHRKDVACAPASPTPRHVVHRACTASPSRQKRSLLDHIPSLPGTHQREEYRLEQKGPAESRITYSVIRLISHRPMIASGSVWGSNRTLLFLFLFYNGAPKSGGTDHKRRPATSIPLPSQGRDFPRVEEEHVQGQLSRGGTESTAMVTSYELAKQARLQTVSYCLGAVEGHKPPAGLSRLGDTMFGVMARASHTPARTYSDANRERRRVKPSH